MVRHYRKKSSISRNLSRSRSCSRSRSRRHRYKNTKGRKVHRGKRGGRYVLVKGRRQYLK